MEGYLIYVSTDYVFDGWTGVYKESDGPKPINHYGESKLLGENLVRDSEAPYCEQVSFTVGGESTNQISPHGF